MKVLREICLSILIASFLISGAACAQNTARESYDKGMAYAVQGKFTKAKVEFEAALKIDPLYLPAKHSLETIKDVLAQKIKTATAIHLFKGVSYGNKGQYDRAIPELTKALKINPKLAHAYYYRGVAYYKKGEYDRAISEYTKTLKIDPRHAEAYYTRGLAYDKKGEYDRAISEYTKTLKIDPRHAEAYTNRGHAYYNKGQHGRAIRDYNKALKINPKDAITYTNRGLVYFVKLGNKVKGCADWKKACELGICRNYKLAKQKGDCS